MDYAEKDLPPANVTENGKTWEREEFDHDSYQWVRPMEEDEYDWDSDQDDVSLVGIDVPIRLVSVQYIFGGWQVQGAETAGPDYYRPGFTEVINGDFSDSFDEAQAAFDMVREYIKKLS